MQSLKSVGKREFMQHTSKYIKWIEESDSPLVITHHKHPELILSKIKSKKFQDLRGTVKINVIDGDINDPVLLGYGEW